MKMNRFIGVLVALSLLFLVISCSDDDNPSPGQKDNPGQPDQLIISFRDTTLTINENPEKATLLGKFKASASFGDKEETVTFKLNSQSVEGAIALNESTGELTVADTGVFDFETNPQITASIEAMAGDSSKTATVQINIANLPDEWMQVGSDIFGEAGGDQFGRGVSLNGTGTVMVVGAPQNDGNAISAGHARVFSRNSITSEWIQVGDDIDGGSGDMSGLAVDIDETGNRVIIGSYKGNSNLAPGNAHGRGGHVRVFAVEKSSWTKVGTTLGGFRLSPAGTQNDANFGQAVAISSSGKRIVVGAPSIYGGMNSAGYTAAFSQSGTEGWSQLGARIEGSTTNQRTGYAVSLSEDGNIQAVGRPESSSRRGSVDVYELIGDTWTQIGASIDGDNTADRIGIGVSLSKDGNIIAVGADRNGQSDKPGYFKVYRNEGGEWVQLGSTIYGRDNGDRLGQGINLSGDGHTLVVGGFDSTENGEHSGYVRVYKFDEDLNDWIQSGPDFEGQVGDRFGVAVSINTDGTSIIIGADQYHNDANPGYLRTYTLQ